MSDSEPGVQVQEGGIIRALCQGWATTQTLLAQLLSVHGGQDHWPSCLGRDGRDSKARRLGKPLGLGPPTSRFPRAKRLSLSRRDGCDVGQSPRLHLDTWIDGQLNSAFLSTGPRNAPHTPLPSRSDTHAEALRHKRLPQRLWAGNCISQKAVLQLGPDALWEMESTACALQSLLGVVVRVRSAQARSPAAPSGCFFVGAAVLL